MVEKPEKPKPRYKEFGERLVTTCCARNTSKKDIAEATGMTEHAVTRWEKGEVWPRPESFKMLIRTLGVTSSWLHDGKDDGMADGVLAALFRFQNMSREDQTAIANRLGFRQKHGRPPVRRPSE
jgi:transcriptional regulator with XRE-family HTH domain